MEEYVKKQNVIDALNIISDKMTDDGQVVMKQAADIVRDVVPADVREVVHSKWIDGFCEKCGYDGGVEAVSGEMNFCPHCGADMRKG